MVHRREPHGEEHRRGERDVHAAQLGRGRAGERHNGRIRVGAAAEADAAEHDRAFRRGHVDDPERDRGLGRVRDDAVGTGVVGRGEIRAVQVRERHGLDRRGDGDGDVRRPEPELGARIGAEAAERAHDGGLAGRHDPRPGHVDREHRQTEDRRLEERLLVDPADVGRGLQVALLRTHERFADAHRPGSGAQLLREVPVDPLAVLEEVGVAVLVAGAGDERRLLPREGLRPVERLRHAGHDVAVDEVVARMAAGAEDEAVREVRRRVVELRCEDARLEVRCKRAVRTEMPGEVDDVVALRSEELRPELVSGPRGWILRGEVRRCDERLRRTAGSRLELRLDRIRGVGEKVVAGHERGARREDAIRVGEVGVDHPRCLGRCFDQATNREVRHREDARAQRDARLRPVRVLAQDVVEAQARFGRGRRAHGREVPRLLAEQALVRGAEERDDVVTADDRHVAQGIVRPVGVDDVLDRLGEQVLRERASGAPVSLARESDDPRARREVDDDAVRPTGKRRQPCAEGRSLCRSAGHPRRIGEDDDSRRLPPARAQARSRCRRFPRGTKSLPG